MIHYMIGLVVGSGFVYFNSAKYLSGEDKGRVLRSTIFINLSGLLTCIFILMIN